MANTSTHTIIVAMGIIPRTVPALIVRATSVANAMEANKATFINPTPTIAVFLADISALGVAEANTKTRAVGTFSIRDDKRQVVVADMHQLHGYVQQLASATPAQAQIIAENAAMALKKAPATHKSDLAVKQVLSGVVKVVAKSVKGARSHEWQVSTDGGKTWTNTTPSAQATTTISGLQPGVMTMFRQRVIMRTGPSDWSQPISALVS
jgi:hypothetical protein